MLDFTFCNRTKIVFGRNSYEHLGDELKYHQAGKVLVHYGNGSVKRNGLLKTVRKQLRDSCIPFTELGGVQPNPRLSLVHTGITLCHEEHVDFILAVGGGSVIDSAKAIAAGYKLSDGDNIWDYYMDSRKVLRDSLPIGIILTLPATGSESSNSSVITDESTLTKRSIEQDTIIPRFALLNPEITFALPPYQTACGAADIIAHMMERYFTQVPDNDFTDRLIEAGIRTMLIQTPKVFRDPTDYSARAEIMWCGTIAHNGLLNTGRIGDWASHMIEHELSAASDIAHGAGLAIVFPAWMKYVYKENTAKFFQFAHRVFDIDLDYMNEDAAIITMIQKLEDFFTSIGLPTRLTHVGIDSSHFTEMAEKALVNRGTIGNFCKLRKEDIVKILHLAL